MGSITIRIDDETKAQAEAELVELGTTHTDVITGVYHYIIRYHRLPFSPDDHALAVMRVRLAEVSEIATNLSLIVNKQCEVNTVESKSVVALLDRFTAELESNWTAMKRASNNHLPQAWTTALQSAKGLSYFLSMTGRPHGQNLSFSDPREIGQAISHLVNASAQINR